MVTENSARLTRGIKLGVFEKITADMVDQKHVIPGARNEYGVPSEIFSTLIGFSTKSFPAGKAQPSTFADFWDVAKFPGKRTLQDDPATVIESALIADGVAPGDVYKVLSTPAGIDRAMKQIEKIKPHVAMWWKNGAEPVNALGTGEVVMALGWNGRFQAGIDSGLPIQMGWGNTVAQVGYFVLVKGRAAPRRGAQADELHDPAEESGRVQQVHRLRPDHRSGVPADRRSAQTPPAVDARTHEERAVPRLGILGEERPGHRRALQPDPRPLTQSKELPRRRPARQIRDMTMAHLAPDLPPSSLAARRRFSPALLAALPLLVFLLCFFVGPIAGLLKQGFVSDGTLSLANYRHLIDTPIYRIVLGNTFTIAFFVTLSCIVMSYPLAYLMATVSQNVSRLLFFAVLLPFWASALVRTSAWIALLGTNGPLNTLLTHIGVLDQPMAFLYNFTGVMIGMTHVLMPFVVLPLYASFRAMDNTLVQAAQSLGAGSVGIFNNVVLPLTSPGVVAGGIIVFMNAVGYYITPSLMGGPAQRMVAELISYNISEELNWGLAAALAGVLLVTVLASLWTFNRLFGLDRLISGSAAKAPARRRRGERRAAGCRWGSASPAPSSCCCRSSSSFR